MSATCSRETQVLELHGELLPQAEVPEVQEHLETCGHCRSMVEDLQALDGLLSAPRPEEASGERVLLSSLATVPDRVSARPAAGRVLQLAAVVAALALIALLVHVRFDSAASMDSRSSSDGGSADLQVSEVPVSSGIERAVQDAADSGAAESEVVDLQSIPILHRLARGSDVAQARRAIGRLALLGRSESLPALQDAVRMRDRRLPAIAALGALGDERAVASIAPFLDDELCAAAARTALIRVGGAEAARALDVAFGTAEDPAERRQLLAAVAQVGGRAAIHRLGGLLADPEAKLAEQVLLRHEERLAPHAAAGLTGASQQHVERALRVLTVIDAPQAVPGLGRLLSHRDHAGQAAALLVAMDTEQAAEVLWSARPTGSVRQAFRRAGPQTERWLLRELAEGDARARRLAIDLLGFCGSPQAVEHMVALVDQPALAPGVLACLGRLGSDAAVDALAQIAGKSALRRSAIQSLGMTGSLRAVAPLVHLAESERSLRTQVRRALAAIPCAEAVEAIVSLDDGRDSPRTTERALRGMDRELVLTTLDSLLDKDPPIEGRLAVTTRRVRDAVGGPVGAAARRVAFN